MIESPQNEKLKLVRKLRDRKHREREGLFATEGEDLLEAGLTAGAEPRFVLVAAGSGLEGEEVEPGLLAAVSALGSGTRVIAVWPQPHGDRTQLSPHTGDNCVRFRRGGGRSSVRAPPCRLRRGRSCRGASSPCGGRSAGSRAPQGIGLLISIAFRTAA